ncbi:MAG TPA: GGDEF domain-containing protein, partial [Xanthobacteraceae bacterium]
MSLQGPIVIIADGKNPVLVSALAAGGAFPIVEATWSHGADAIARIEPAAVVMAAAEKPAEIAAAKAVRAAVDAADGPYVPVIARVADGAMPATGGALPIAADASPERLAIRLASALRVRTLHATALRRADALKHEYEDLPALPASDPLEDATVIVTGRGRTYPGLTTAVGEQVGLIG